MQNKIINSKISNNNTNFAIFLILFNKNVYLYLILGGYMNKLKTKKINLKLIFKYLFTFLLIIILINAKIYDSAPFAPALLFALMWTGFNVWIISAEYLISSLMVDLSLQNLYTAITTVFVLIAVFFFHKKLKHPMNLAVVSIYCLLSQITYIYYCFSKNLAIGKIVSFLFLIVIAFSFYAVVFQVMLSRGLYYKLTLNEAIAYIFLFITLGIGLSEFVFYNIEVVKIFALITLLVLSLVKKYTEACYLTLALGVGSSIYNFDYLLLANFAILILASNVFKYPNKYKMYFCVLAIDICFALYFLGFNFDCIPFVLPVVLGITVTAFIPEKLITKMQDKFYVCENEMNMRNIVSITRKNLHRRFNELSNVFNEMKTIHLNLIKQDLSHTQVVSMLTNEIMKHLCKDCLDKQKCFRSYGEEASVISKLVDLALKKGKISLLDIPSNLAMRCSMVNLLIGRVNQIVSQYTQFVGMKKDVNNVKYLLAEQLGAVSRIMLDLGEELDKNISFDTHKESQLINELLSENILCSEIVIYNEDNDNCSVNLTVKGDNAYNPKIEDIISKKMHTKMKVNKIVPIETNGFYSVNLSKDNNYDIIFGLTSCTKEGSEISGDTHSLIRLGNNRFLIALCDGMGSGDTANKTSSLTIGLIENFYKAGFNNDIIIASVNKLLAINNQESYATLDLCLVDLNKESIDFIKIGSPYSFVKHDASLEKIEGGALPIGVLDNIQPKTYQTTIDTKSMVIMATDGITDAFKEIDDFAEFIEGIASTNPQIVAQTILDEAIRRNDNVIKDDMTVLVTRTFKKNG